MSLSKLDIFRAKFGFDPMTLMDSDRQDEFIKILLEQLEASKKLQTNFNAARESLQSNHSPENLAKMVDITMKYFAQQQQTVQNVLLISLIYTCGDGFNSDASKVAMKFSDNSEDALKAMLDTKMKDK